MAFVANRNYKNIFSLFHKIANELNQAQANFNENNYDNPVRAYKMLSRIFVEWQQIEKYFLGNEAMQSKCLLTLIAKSLNYVPLTNSL